WRCSACARGRAANPAPPWLQTGWR
ncbi:methyl-accepting chemotaxis protein, partial [Bordetella hinzii L60]